MQWRAPLADHCDRYRIRCYEVWAKDIISCSFNVPSLGWMVHAVPAEEDPSKKWKNPTLEKWHKLVGIKRKGLYWTAKVVLSTCHDPWVWLLDWIARTVWAHHGRSPIYVIDIIGIAGSFGTSQRIWFQSMTNRNGCHTILPLSTDLFSFSIHTAGDFKITGRQADVCFRNPKTSPKFRTVGNNSIREALSHAFCTRIPQTLWNGLDWSHKRPLMTSARNMRSIYIHTLFD